jgi:hypothetical protein
MEEQIYFIKAESGHVKIGITGCDVERRMYALQTGNPYKLSILKIIKGNRGQEALIHQKFKHLRCRREWFVLSNELESFIENPYTIEQKPTKRRSDTATLNKQRIVFELEHRGWFRYQLAEKMGKKPHSIYGLMHRPEHTSLRTIDRLAEALGLDPKDLIL